MPDSKACLLSYALDGQGAAVPVEMSAVTADDPRLVWVHLNARHPDAKKFLRDQIQLDPLIIKALVAEETRPRLEELSAGALLILRGINYNPGPTPEDLVSIRLWIGNNRIISLGRRKSAAIADIDARIQQNRAPKSIGDFIATLCGALNDTIEPAIAELEEAVDLLEEDAQEDVSADKRPDLAQARKQATLFRRHLGPQRDVIMRLQRPEQPWLSAADRWLMQENSDRITRFIEDLDALRERTQILQDEAYNLQSVRLNKNLYILSMITVIFLPLTFITGLLGMNLEGIPGAHLPNAFLVVCGLCVGIGAVQLMIFRRLKWF